MTLIRFAYLLASLWMWVELPAGGMSMTYPPIRLLLNTPTAQGTILPPLLMLPNATLYTVFDEVTTYPYEADTMISWQGLGLQGSQRTNMTPRGSGFFDNDAWNSTESVVTVGLDMELSGSAASGSSDGLDWEMVSAPSEDGSTFQQVLLGVGLYTLSLLTLAGNTMVLHAIRTERRLQTVSNMFIMSLAVADLTVGLIVMPISSAYALANEWQMGDFICLFWLSADYTASTASILNLLILSLDRYWSITSPLRYMRKRTKKRALVMIAFVWLVSAMWIVPIVFWQKWYPEEPGRDSFGNPVFASEQLNYSKDCETKFSDNVIFKLTASMLNFYIPMVLMIVLYFKIFMEVKKRSKFAIGENQICYATHAVCSSPGRSISRKTLAKDVDFVSDGNESLSVHDDGNKIGGTSSSSSGSHQGHSGTNHKHLVVSTVVAKEKKRRRARKSDEAVAGDGLSSEGAGSDWEPERDSGNSGDSYKSTVAVPLPSVPGHGSANTCTPCLIHVRTDGATGAPVTHNKALLERKTNMRTSPNGPSPNATVILPSANGNNSSFYMSRKRRKNRKDAGNSVRESYELSEKVGRGGVVAAGGGGSNASTPLDNNPSAGSSMKRCRAPFRLRVTRNNYAANLGQQKKAARQLGVIIGAFVACWLPYIVVFITTAICPACISSSLHTTVIWLGYLNSTINPFLYALCNANFKIAFKKMFCHHNPHAFMLGHRSVDNKADNNHMFA